jgi:hypothetical protein
MFGFCGSGVSKVCFVEKLSTHCRISDAGTHQLYSTSKFCEESLVILSFQEAPRQTFLDLYVTGNEMLGSLLVLRVVMPDYSVRNYLAYLSPTKMLSAKQ